MLKLSMIFTKYPKYQGSGCTACLKCQEVCPTEAIVVLKEDNKRPVFNYDLCSSSFKCLENCPERVIHRRKLKYRDLIILISLTLSLLIAAIIFAFV
ncbi:MAG: 4Fe-4S dicluster domain-containing protein [Candidatus Heimdallarchaeota archaeon]|nr:4Fe-4S dicluster domain-containing protein [Candidatus Heimdallarchaeota archaeon]